MERNYFELINECISFYDIGKLVEIIEILKPKDNLVIKFRTTEYIFILKEYTRGFENVKKYAQTLIELKSLNFPIPLIFTNNNSPYLELNSKLYTIDAFIEGNKINWKVFDDEDIEKIRKSARFLAELHKKTIKTLPESTIKNRVKDFKIIEYFFNDIKGIPRGIIRYTLAKENKDEFDNTIIQELFPLVQKTYEYLKNNVPKIPVRNRLSILHGDFWHDHIIFNGAQIAAVIDWEMISMDFAGYDLSRAIHTFATSKEGYNLQSLRTFLDSYTEIYGKLEIPNYEIICYIYHSILTILANILGTNILRNKSPEESLIRVVLNFTKRIKFFQENENEIMSILESYN